MNNEVSSFKQLCHSISRFRPITPYLLAIGAIALAIGIGLEIYHATTFGSEVRWWGNGAIALFLLVAFGLHVLARRSRFEEG